tara:strand:+ start:947 stop:1186 length:240 start_codon:yes stop_codon:yes gene_type:complete
MTVTSLPEDDDDARHETTSGRRRRPPPPLAEEEEEEENRADADASECAKTSHLVLFIAGVGDHRGTLFIKVFFVSRRRR